MIITMPKVLMDKLGNDGAEALALVLNNTETATRTDLVTKSDLAETKADILKWIVVMWAAQIGTTVALFFRR